MSVTWRRRWADIGASLVVLIIGVGICDAWLHLSPYWMFIGGGVTFTLADFAGEIAADIAG